VKKDEHRVLSDGRVSGALLVLAMSRVAALAGHDVHWSWWSPAAYLWHDGGIALLFAAAEQRLRRMPRLAWTVYALFVIYVAVNVPVTRVMSTPLTWTIWRAAGGALSDSIRLYVTAANVSWIIAIVAAAIAPLIIHHEGHQGHKGQAVQGSSLVSFVSFVVIRRRSLVIAALAGIVALGPAAAARVDTRGLERNAWSALIVSALPRVAAEASLTNVVSGPPGGGRHAADWRLPRAASAPSDDLTRFRGAAAGRNVVLVSLESTAAAYLGLYGAQPDVAPNLFALAESAIVFDNAYAVYPESIRGLFSMLCSVYPAFDRTAESDSRGPCRSIASLLADSGYRTALFHSGRFDYLGMDAVVRNRGFDVLADAGDIGGHRESSFGVDDRATVDRMLEWIDRIARGERFFITYLPLAGHHPYEVPDCGPFPAADEFGRYRNALRYGDEVLGHLIAGLRARGLESNTVWMVIGDHGEAFGQHDGNFGHTFQLYEENVHVPFLIAAPGAIPRQVRSGRVVSAIDVAPTLLDLVGAAPADSHQGQSVLDARPRMALFFADYSLGLLGLRDGRLKYIYEIESGRSRLFDLDRDPQEASNLADRNPEAARWYRQRLRQWSAAQKARLP
jgi:sulfatase-like protein